MVIGINYDLEKIARVDHPRTIPVLEESEI